MRDNKTINFAGLHGVHGQNGNNNDSLALLRLEIDELRRENQVLRGELERIAAAHAADAVPLARAAATSPSATSGSFRAPIGAMALSADESAVPRPFSSPTNDPSDRSSRANFTAPAGPSAAAQLQS
jgi:hypothetical protein